MINNLNNTIESLIQKKQHILDCGCGDGSLLTLLNKTKQTTGYGIDIDENNILNCIQKNIPAYHGDILEGLSALPDKSFDVVILSQTLQQIQNPDTLLEEICRVGKIGIVSFPNFSHWRCRLQLLNGKIPQSKALPFSWYSTPNIRVISIKSFKEFCTKKTIEIIKTITLSKTGKQKFTLFSNLFSEQGLFIVKKES